MTLPPEWYDHSDIAIIAVVIIGLIIIIGSRQDSITNYNNQIEENASPTCINDFQPPKLK